MVLTRIIRKQYNDKSAWAYWPQFKKGNKWKHFKRKELPWAIDDRGPIYGNSWWGSYIRKVSMVKWSFNKIEEAEKYIREYLNENEEEYQEALAELEEYLDKP